MDDTTTTTSAAVADAPVTTSTESAPLSTPVATTTTAPARPTSMLDALQKAEEGQGAPQSPSSANGQSVPPQGPIPFDVHKTALENARTKAQAEALRGLTPQQFEAMTGWWQRAQRDTTGFLTDTIAEHPHAIEILQRAAQTLMNHPTHGPSLKSATGKALAALRGQKTPEVPAMVKVQLEDGSVVAMPRDPEAYLAYHRSQWDKSVGEKLAPLNHTVESLKAEHDAAVQEAQIDHFVTTTVDDVKSWQGVDAEGMKAIALHIKDQPIDWNDPRAISGALNAAYRAVIVPTLTAKGQAAYAASQKQKAAAAIEHASTSAASPLAKPKNPAQLAAYLAALDAGGR